MNFELANRVETLVEALKQTDNYDLKVISLYDSHVTSSSESRNPWPGPARTVTDGHSGESVEALRNPADSSERPPVLSAVPAAVVMIIHVPF